MFTRRDMFRFSAALTAIPFADRLGFAEATASPAGNSSRDPLDYVNAEFRPTLKALSPILESSPPLSTSTLAQTRARGAHDYFPPLPKPAVTEHSVPGSAEGQNIRVFVIGDSPDSSKPAVLHIHEVPYAILSPSPLHPSL